MTDPVARLNAALEGRYAIERELGEGGMATVYLAGDLKHGRKVALKVLKPELAAVVGADRSRPYGGHYRTDMLPDFRRRTRQIVLSRVFSGRTLNTVMLIRLYRPACKYTSSKGCTTTNPSPLNSI